VGIEQVEGGLSAAAKVERIHQLQAEGQQVLMIGDGINDAPVLSAADLSFAMTNASDLTKSSADAILQSGQLNHLISAWQICRKARAIIRENLGWALCYNLSALPLAAMGLVPPWLAAIGMSASSLVVVLNALRIRKSG